MAIIVYTTRPKSLLTAIKRAIDSNKIETWSYDSDGDFTHTPPQWANKAWLRPVIDTDTIRFVIFGRKGASMQKNVYAAYHGHFVEMLLNHFDEEFTRVNSTALPSAGDNVGP